LRFFYVKICKILLGLEMKKILCIFLLLTFFLSAQTYQQQWKIVDKLDKKNLPKQALKEVASIYQRAIKEQNDIEILHSILEKMRYKGYIEDNSDKKNIYFLEKELKKDYSIPNKLIIKSILASLYDKYREEHSYTISNRTNIKDDNSTDIATWTIDRLNNRAMRLYLESIRDEAKYIDIKKYKPILSEAKNTYELEPTLYDFLLFRALYYFENERSYITKPKENFVINEAIAFGDISSFINYQFPTINKKSSQYQSLLLYQKLLYFHWQNGDKLALQHANISRLEFVYNHFIGNNRNRYYLEALEQIKSQNIEALLYLAEYYQNKQEYKKAIEYANKGINTPNRYTSIRCKSIKDNIEAKEINIELENVNLPHNNILTKVEYKNIDKLYVKVIKITDKILIELKKDRKIEKKLEYINSLTAINQFDIALPKADDYKKHTTEVSLGSYDLGYYLIVISKDRYFSNKRLIIRRENISKIGYFYRNSSFLVVDRVTGKPMSGVIANIYNKSKKVATYKSNSEGVINIAKTNTAFSISFQKDNDKLRLDNDKYYSNNYSTNIYRKKIQKRVIIFTDRAIYKPSQKIYFKGLAVESYQNKKPKILTNKSIVISLYNTNNQKLKTQEFKTDNFGTFHGYFIAPKSGRLGNMSLRVNKMGYKNIRIEEYKRPKFEVNFEPFTKTYRLEDKVTITGEAKALSGYGLSGAKVKYSVQRVVSFPWWEWWRPIKHFPTQQIASSQTTTDQNGKFHISFDAIADPNIPAKDKPNFSYKISVDITDTTGETHSNSKTINIGYVAIKADMLIDKEININNNSGIKLITTNLDNKFQPLQGKVVIEKLKPKDKVYRNRYWSVKNIDKPLYTKEQFQMIFPNYIYPKDVFSAQADIIKTINFDTGKSKTIKLKGLPQGKYKFTLYTRDKYGTEVKKSKTNIIVYNLKEKNPPILTDLWKKLDKKSYKIGQKAKLILKSSTPNSWVRLEVHRGNKVQEKWIEFNKLTQNIIQITKQDRGNILYRLTMIKNNRIHYYQGAIFVPWNDKLKVEFISFRDKLKPNTKEQWRIKISGKDKEKVMAQMVATMYDASLDKFIQHSFYKPNIFPYQNYIYNRWKAKGFGTIRAYAQWQNYTMDNEDRVFYNIKDKYNINIIDGLGGDIEPVMSMAPISSNISSRVVASSQGIVSEADTSNSYSQPNIELNPKQSIHIRRNLQESMFFKPNLQTDADGNIIINFKTNDALTRWNFLAFVHTKELQSAIVKKVITTQKELTVVTNLPRFFREGDKIWLTEKIVNLSNRDLKGECELQLKNPINGWNIYGNHKFIKPFYLKKGATTTVAFYIHIPTVDSVPAIEHTIIARTQTHTDAEQMVKPILTNREFVTESKALWLRGNESKTFILQSLKDNNSTTLKNYKLTLEFTSNPVWYAIKSIPYLMEYPHECNEQLFSRYFANALSANIINQHPKIKKVFESWRARGSLKSPLSINQELKSVMLEETPWLITAQSEEQQERNIALLFDLDKLAQKQKETLKRLFQNQNSDGGWSWFSGGKSNWYITQYILAGFGKLSILGIKNDKVYKQIYNATSFIDKKLIEEYNKLQKNIEKGYTKQEDDHLNSRIIYYLYYRLSNQVPFTSQVSKIYNYYISQAKTYWRKRSLYEQGLIALAIYVKDKDKAKAIVKSIKERAIRNPELGMYFKEKWGYHWFQLPIETQSLMIELFTRVTHDTKSVEELKVWLLKNKQTTHWKTTKATLNAIYALLINDNWLDNDKLVDISFDTKIDYKPIIEKAKREAQKGTGYFKATFDKFNKSMATIKVTNPNSNIVWGGLYWQYFEDMNKIKTFKETPLTIDKKLYIYDDLGSNQLIPITNQTLKIGDKIKSRIEIRVDRDMEFIMLKDGRASAFEPINVLSQYKWQDGLGYYESTKDNATYFFFNYLPKGTYVFEYPLLVTHKGEFSSGIATIESMYAPEFRSHSEGLRLFIPSIKTYY